MQNHSFTFADAGFSPLLNHSRLLIPDCLFDQEKVWYETFLVKALDKRPDEFSRLLEHPVKGLSRVERLSRLPKEL